MRLSRMLTDRGLETKGVWVQYHTDFHVKLRRYDTSMLVEELGDRRATLRRSRSIDEDAQIDAIKKVYAERVVIDWRGLEDDDGSEIPFSSDRCLELFNDPRADDFFQFVRECANDMAVFQAQAEGDLLGNSPTTSNGTSSTDANRASSKTDNGEPARSTPDTQPSPTSTTKPAGTSTRTS